MTQERRTHGDDVEGREYVTPSSSLPPPLPHGCPQCAVIQSIPSFGLSLFSLLYSFKYVASKDKRIAVPLALYGIGYMYVGYNVYDVTLNPSYKFDYYTPLGAGIGVGMIALSQVSAVRSRYPSPLHNNLLLAGITSLFFYGARTWFLKEKGVYNGWQ